MSRRRRSKTRSRLSQRALDRTDDDISIASIVIDSFNGNIKNNPSIPKPAVPVAIRDEADEETRARKNSEYYSRRGGQEKKQWFHCPRHKYKYSEDVLVSPAMARELMGFNPMNRNMSDGVVDAYRRDIENDRWISSHESIGIDLSGNLFDGQHRLTAIIESNSSQIVYITFNVPVEARFVVDGGKKRATAQKLRYIDPSINSKIPPICRAMMRGPMSGNPGYTDTEIAVFLSKHGEMVAWAQKQLPNAIRSDVVAVIAKAAIMHGEDSVVKFCEGYKNVQFDNGDPAKALFLYLTKAKQAGKSPKPDMVYRKTLAAINAHLQNRKIEKLQQRDEDIFDWLPGWEVPANA